MGLDVGKLQATLNMDTSGFVKGVTNARNSAKRLGSELEGDLAKPMDNTSTSSDNLTGAIKDMSTAAAEAKGDLNGAASEVERFGAESKDAAGNVRQVGTEAETSSGKVSGLKDMLGKIGVTVGIGAVIGAIIEIGKAALQTSDDVDNSMRSIAVSTGARGIALEQYLEVVQELKRQGYGEDVVQTVGTVAQYNKGADMETIKELSAEYQSLIELRGSVGDSVSVESMDAAFKKWGIATNEQIEYLRFFYKVAEQSGIEVNQLADALSDGDRGFQLMGLSMKQAAAYLGEANISGTLDDVIALTEVVERLQAEKATLLTEEGTPLLASDDAAEKYITDVMNYVKTLKDESEAVAYLVDELSLAPKTARTIAAAVFSDVGEIDTVAESIDGMTESLQDLNMEYATSEQQNARIAENAKKYLEPLGESIQNIRDNLDDIIQQENSLKVLFDLLNVNSYSSIQMSTDPPVQGIQPLPMTNPYNQTGRASEQNNTTVNQYFNVPTVDPYTMQQAAQQMEYDLANNPNYR